MADGEDDLQTLVLTHGADKARDMVPAKDRPLVDIISTMLADEANALGITYAGFCLTALPHKRLPDDQMWERHNGRCTLVVSPGPLRIKGKVKQIGVPYGSLARVILIFLQTRAIQTQSREIEIGGSMHEWLGKMGVSSGGKTYRLIEDQVSRLNACNLAFFWDDASGEKFNKDNFIRGGHIPHVTDDRQQELWENTVTLSETFFKALRDHPVPVSELALRQISNQSMAIDLYVWLAYRLHVLERPVRITWPGLYAQFGAGYKSLMDFRKRAREALRYAKAVYPQANVLEWEEGKRSKGLELRPSPPPVIKTALT
jgi:hypothetical protein